MKTTRTWTEQPPYEGVDAAPVRGHGEDDGSAVSCPGKLW